MAADNFDFAGVASFQVLAGLLGAAFDLVVASFASEVELVSLEASSVGSVVQRQAAGLFLVEHSLK